MNRFSALVLTASLAASLTAAAQTTQPGPESTNTNRNSPQLKTNASPETQRPAAATRQDAASEQNKPAAAPAAGAGSATGQGTPTSAPAAVGAASPETKGSAAQSAPPQSKAEEGDSQPGAPKTPRAEMFGTPSTGPASADPLLEPPPVPPGKTTLIGGLTHKIDHVRNRLEVRPFGTRKRIRMIYDERSHFYRDGRETTVLAIREGDRVYVDTMLDGPRIFAKNVRVVTTGEPAEAQGQIIAFDDRRQTVRMLDTLTNQQVVFTLTPDTRFTAKSGAARREDIRPGSLINVLFAPRRKGGQAREVLVLATPGSTYLFAGRITNIDLRSGVVNIENQSDGRNYELRFDPATVDNREELIVGTEVAANSTFDGRTYKTQNLSIIRGAAETQESAEQYSANPPTR